MKKFVSIKGVIDNIRQSVNTPSPPGANASGANINSNNANGNNAANNENAALENQVLENLSPEQFRAENTFRYVRQSVWRSSTFNSLALYLLN